VISFIIFFILSYRKSFFKYFIKEFAKSFTIFFLYVIIYLSEKNMKKLFSAIVAIFIVSVFSTLAACGGVSAIAFNNSFYGSPLATISSGYTETCEYSASFKPAQNFSSNVIDSVNFSDGEFITTLTVLPEYPEELPDTDLYDRNAQVLSSVLCYKTSFSVKASYVIAGETREFSDTVETEVYFLPSESSFAPLYSKTKSKTGNPLTNESVSSEYSVLYKSSSYTISGDTERTVNYTPKTVVDNAQLLFVIRNFELSDMGTAFPVVAKAFNGHLSVAFTAKSSEKKTYNLNLNGESADYSFNVQYGYFNVNSNETRGYEQSFTIQKQGKIVYNKYSAAREERFRVRRRENCG